MGCKALELLFTQSLQPPLEEYANLLGFFLQSLSQPLYSQMLVTLKDCVPSGTAMIRPLLSLFVSGSFCWFVASSLWLYPHSLSYFNESVGGPLNGADHLLGSNIDWGQDLLYALAQRHNQNRALFVFYSGGYLPYSLVPEEVPNLKSRDALQLPHASCDDPSNKREVGESRPLILVSMNTLYGMPGEVRSVLYPDSRANSLPRSISVSRCVPVGRCTYSIAMCELLNN